MYIPVAQKLGFVHRAYSSIHPCGTRAAPHPRLSQQLGYCGWKGGCLVSKCSSTSSRMLTTNPPPGTAPRGLPTVGTCMSRRARKPKPRSGWRTSLGPGLCPARQLRRLVEGTVGRGATLGAIAAKGKIAASVRGVRRGERERCGRGKAVGQRGQSPSSSSTSSGGGSVK
jgi:hypothetical protein